MAHRQRAHPTPPTRSSFHLRPVAIAVLLCAPLALAATGALAQAASAAPQHAHVHGVARLDVVVQDKTLSITFESPLQSLIGFEHRPTTPAQVAAVNDLRTRMRTARELFSFDADAGCGLTKADAESAIFGPATSGAADTHADLDASFEFRCARPERLTQLEVGLFAVYPGLQQLDVEVVTDRGQFRRDLKRPSRMVALTR
jgi:hypothetical protein